MDAQHVLDGTHHAVDFALDCGHQRVPHPGDAVQQAGDDVLADVAPFIHTAVPHAGQLGDAGEGGFAQILNAAENAVHQCGQKSRTAVQKVGQMGDQRGRELCNQLQLLLCISWGRLSVMPMMQLSQQLDADIEDTRPDGQPDTAPAW